MKKYSWEKRLMLEEIISKRTLHFREWEELAERQEKYLKAHGIKLIKISKEQMLEHVNSIINNDCTIIIEEATKEE